MIKSYEHKKLAYKFLLQNRNILLSNEIIMLLLTIETPEEPKKEKENIFNLIIKDIIDTLNLDKRKTIINNSKDIVSLELNTKKDFIYFLDSTMFRIWYLNENASKLLNNKLKFNPIFTNNGVFVNKIIAKKV